jgi:hypothetical protein
MNAKGAWLGTMCLLAACAMPPASQPTAQPATAPGASGETVSLITTRYDVLETCLGKSHDDAARWCWQKIDQKLGETATGYPTFPAADECWQVIKACRLQ